MYPTVAETLRCGGDKLAVDGILLIGEHGDYPTNELGQILYPRYELFKECVEVFEADGRSVPIYNDKHLSYSFAKAQEMVADGERLGFPLLAGSSLPVTYRLPDLELPYGCQIEEAVMLGVGGSDAMDYHALEAMQCMIEEQSCIAPLHGANIVSEANIERMKGRKSAWAKSAMMKHAGRHAGRQACR